MALSVSASAQRKSVTYGSAGVTGQWLSNSVGNLGFGAAFGFRNYNRDAFISFTAGAEAYAYVVPSTSGSIFGGFGRTASRKFLTMQSSRPTSCTATSICFIAFSCMSPSGSLRKERFSNCK